MAPTAVWGKIRLSSNKGNSLSPASSLWVNRTAGHTRLQGLLSLPDKCVTTELFSPPEWSWYLAAIQLEQIKGCVLRQKKRSLLLPGMVVQPR